MCAFISTVVLTLVSSCCKEDGIVGMINTSHQKERRGSEKKGFILVDTDSMNVSSLQDFQFGNVVSPGGNQGKLLEGVSLSRKPNSSISVLTGGFQPKGPIERIAILGERHSGTRWMTSELSRCFNHSLEVRTRCVQQIVLSLVRMQRSSTVQRCLST